MWRCASRILDYPDNPEKLDNPEYPGTIKLKKTLNSKLYAKTNSIIYALMWRHLHAGAEQFEETGRGRH